MIELRWMKCMEHLACILGDERFGHVEASGVHNGG